MSGLQSGNADATAKNGAMPSPPPVLVLAPAEQTAPIVVSSPHSGLFYPPDLTAASRLDRHTLRRSEDSFVDELYGLAPKCGVPLITATHARAYVDCNREPFELDPALIAGPLPDYANTASDGVRTGFGTIARRVAPEHDIYAGTLTVAEAERRVRAVYRPYHQALRTALDRCMRRFGQAFLIDAHSMPKLTPEGGEPASDIVLGDRYGRSADAGFVDAVHGFLEKRGYRVARNRPYAGGFITQRYGRPEDGRHAVQIEIDRSLYMNEVSMTKTPDFDTLRGDITALLAELGEWTTARPRACGHAG